MSSSIDFLPVIMAGLTLTIKLTLLGSIVATIVAFAVGFARLSNVAWLSIPARLFMEFFRGTSMVVQLFWAYFVLPLFGISLTPFEAGVLIIGLNSGAYMSEIVRGGMLALPLEQYEACIALNLGRWQRLRHVFLPQALPPMLPPFTNSAVELLKSTSVVSLISLSDITFQAQTVRTQTGDAFVPFAAILIIYYFLATILSSLMRLAERRLRPTSSARI
ncbi:ectoine/hydroxyectoine ABC transporter permease protein EhuC 2 (plasmid) [Rhizobium gallicum]|uniref:Ectoine/hydroxyectoine ABC transporter permease protein EhuC 2 n=1 Tax=Rhizobium gallicum TaxID=56730 RepID=A0A1L5NR58_9HYPH|nr:ectoine/hydroxyectoine ABC transporter permease subunit EhuC [Rhizobium gallicum]APO70391.1 ectoine/hydroxyectoine ABC transporter permease protein EhuC 2 [Rhizobium gallicum]